MKLLQTHNDFFYNVTPLGQLLFFIGIVVVIIIIVVVIKKH